jgi:hypothetical protein
MAADWWFAQPLSVHGRAALLTAPLWLVMVLAERLSESERDSPILRGLRVPRTALSRWSLRLSALGSVGRVDPGADQRYRPGRLESDFLPPFDEGAVQINIMLPPGTSLSTSQDVAEMVERVAGDRRHRRNGPRHRPRRIGRTRRSGQRFGDHRHARPAQPPGPQRSPGRDPSGAERGAGDRQQRRAAADAPDLPHAGRRPGPGGHQAVRRRSGRSAPKRGTHPRGDCRRARRDRFAGRAASRDPSTASRNRRPRAAAIRLAARGGQRSDPHRDERSGGLRGAGRAAHVRSAGAIRGCRPRGHPGAGRLPLESAGRRNGPTWRPWPGSTRATVPTRSIANRSGGGSWSSAIPPAADWSTWSGTFNRGWLRSSGSAARLLHRIRRPVRQPAVGLATDRAVLDRSVWRACSWCCTACSVRRTSPCRS